MKVGFDEMRFDPLFKEVRRGPSRDEVPSSAETQLFCGFNALALSSRTDDQLSDFDSSDSLKGSLRQGGAKWISVP